MEIEEKQQRNAVYVKCQINRVKKKEQSHFRGRKGTMSADKEDLLEVKLRWD